MNGLLVHLMEKLHVMSSIKKDQAKSDGKPIESHELDKLRSPILEKYEKEGSPYYASARLWDDGIISPTKTREKLILEDKSNTFN